MDAKNRARLEAEGISVQSITPELAAKWGTLMSFGERSGQSKPATPSSIALPEDNQPDDLELQASNLYEKGLQEALDKNLLTKEPITPENKEPA